MKNTKNIFVIYYIIKYELVLNLRIAEFLQYVLFRNFYINSCNEIQEFSVIDFTTCFILFILNFVYNY